MKTSQILLEKNVPCTKRDGTILYSDIYRPNQDGQFPVMLTRLPYSKDLPFYSHRYLDTNRLVENGYVVIIQDVRGRYKSEGEFFPFKYEAADGYDTVEWAAKLPYSSGKVGMFGLSYYGFTQLSAASERPPHLYAIFPAMTSHDSRNGLLFHNGAYELGLFETWVLESIVPDLLKRKHKNEKTYAEAMNSLAKSFNNISEWYRYSPINEWPPIKELGVADFFFELLQYNLEDDFWDKTGIAGKFEQINIPAYHAGGWYDCLLGSTIDNYIKIKKQAEDPKVKDNQKLIVGPWAHGDFSSLIGERSFGVHASENWIDLKEDLTNLHIRWFDYWLKNIDTDITGEAPVKIFVMGINEWRDEQEWPLARTIYTPYYFHSEGKANTRNGDGRLTVKKPADEPVDQFIYDPHHPVLTQGGGTLYDGINQVGPLDQRKVEERDDVLVYTSEPLEEALEVTGPVKVKLWAKTDAKDTDFTGKLVDVLPDGTAYNLTDGIIRARYRNGFIPEADLDGEVVEYEIDLWSTSNVFLPGHSIRIEVSSSNFPRFDINPNTGRTMKDSTEVKIAKQAIYHNEKYPSHVILPIIPAKK
ncbi:CocE/NonD family hydrolase [Scopulibacillus cellulosilyticus]|uniref:CocE/NonD family hydrolase n=1 Tax=Scopulibacillus cellulosilyticus TaxID=2665665 RepID=A0ABW2PSE8_9BACL